MVKADTLAPKKEEKKTTTPLEANTPAEKPKGDPTPLTPQEQKVVELESEVDRITNLLNKQETIAKSSQRDKAIAERKKQEILTTLERIRTGEIDISEINLPAETLPSEEEGIKKDIQIGVQNLLLGNPDYQNVLSQDVTLREVIRKNPLVLIGEFFSVEDAVEQIREKMDERVSSLKKTQPKGEKKKEEKGGKEFEAGPTQPGAGKPEAPAEEPASTSPEDKVEQSIKGKINFT